MKKSLLIAVCSTVCLLAPISRAAEYFTQLFEDESFTLLGTSLTFTPDGSEDYYSANIELISELPVDASGHSPLSLGDDDAEFKRFSEDGSKNLLFYGTRKYACYIGSNGYITLADAGDGSFGATLENHFGTPRISTYYSDWDPRYGGPVRYKSLIDRFVVTYDGVWEYNTISNPNIGTFQTELFYDSGVIRMSWMNMDIDPWIRAGIVGLSSGEGKPVDYVETDFFGVYATDLDQDGILDDWEEYFFDHYSNCLATANFDGDALDNVSEYICGTDPKDPTSYFFCTNTVSSSELVLMWPVMEGRTYRVFKSENLVLDPFAAYATLEYPINAFTDTVSSASACYRVDVEISE